MLSMAAQERICEVRERTGWGPRLIASEVGHPHYTAQRFWVPGHAVTGDRTQRTDGEDAPFAVELRRRSPE